ARAFFGPVTRLAVQELQRKNGIPATGAVDSSTRQLLKLASTPAGGTSALPRNMVVQKPNGGSGGGGTKLSGGIGSGAGETGTMVKGNLVFDHGLPAAGVTVRLYEIGFGGQDTQLAEATSDGQGGYVFSYAPLQKGAPSVQVRV